MKAKAKENLSGYLFVLPSLIGFTIFMLFPVLFSLILSFCDWDLVSGFTNIKFIGLNNFIDIWNDTGFIQALKNNFIYTIVVVPVTMVFSLILAIILNNKVYGKKPLRLLFFLPHISNVVAVSIIWMALYHPTLGPINQFLASIGISRPPQWLADPNWALPAIMAMTIWMGIGYDLIVYMAGLQGIPNQLYEAAEIDGANHFMKFFHVTLPLLSPTTFFLFVTRIITSFQVFGPINVMTEGGPAGATTVLVFEIYKQGFKYYKFGYASAIAWVLFVIIFLITIIQWNRQNKWVTYN